MSLRSTISDQTTRVERKDTNDGRAAVRPRSTLSATSVSHEQAFARHYHAIYYRYAQASLALAVLLILCDFLADHLAFANERANLYRIQLCLPILLAGFAFSFSSYAKRHWQLVMSAIVVAAACSLFWVLAVIDSQGGMGLKSWVGPLNLVFLEFYCFVILGVRFRYALASGLLILLLFEAAMLAEFAASRATFLYLSYQAVTCVILAGGVGWWREFVLRKDFLTQAFLKEARDVLKSQNDLLEREVETRTSKIEHTQEAAFLLLQAVVETRDNETGNHVQRTQHYVRALAKQLQSRPAFANYFSEYRIDLLFKSAPLHDIGKVGIPDSILLKPGKLDADEFSIMQTHTTLGYGIIENAERRLGVGVEFLACAKEIALSHHEKWNGSGYPRKLSGQEIPLSARLMAVADVYDALTTRRVYKDAISHVAAVAIIIDGSGTHFDPDVVDAFVEIADTLESIARPYLD
jgi:hypothetical protein